MLPVDRMLQEMAANLRDVQRRVERLETLEFMTGGDFVLIEHVGISAIFESIPQIFRHLFIIVSAGSSGQAGTRGLRLRFNGDSSVLYKYVSCVAGGSCVSSLGANHILLGSIPVVGSSGVWFNAMGILIPDYRSTIKNKNAVAFNFYFAPGFGEVPDSIATELSGGAWETIATPEVPITELAFTLTGGSSFENGTLFSLYGIR